MRKFSLFKFEPSCICHEDEWHWCGLSFKVDGDPTRRIEVCVKTENWLCWKLRLLTRWLDNKSGGRLESAKVYFRRAIHLHYVRRGTIAFVTIAKGSKDEAIAAMKMVMARLGIVKPIELYTLDEGGGKENGLF